MKIFDIIAKCVKLFFGVKLEYTTNTERNYGYTGTEDVCASAQITREGPLIIKKPYPVWRDMDVRVRGTIYIVVRRVSATRWKLISSANSLIELSEDEIVQYYAEDRARLALSEANMKVMRTFRA